MLNVWCAVGRVAKRQCSRSATNTLICKFTLAVDRDKDKDGNRKTDFINCAIIGNLGKLFESYVEVGTMLSITGPIQTSTYEKDGQQKTITECFVTKYDILKQPGQVQAAVNTQPATAPYSTQPTPQQANAYTQMYGAVPPVPPTPPPHCAPPPEDSPLPFDFYPGAWQ